MKNKLKIHLRDLEAEALEMLVYVYETNPDSLINALVAKEFAAFMSPSETTPPNYQLFQIPVAECLPIEYEDTFPQDAETLSAKNIWRIMRTYSYAMENREFPEDLDVEDLLYDRWLELKEMLLEKTDGDLDSFFYDKDLER